jgi:hypothetical protein
MKRGAARLRWALGVRSVPFCVLISLKRRVCAAPRRVAWPKRFQYFYFLLLLYLSFDELGISIKVIEFDIFFMRYNDYYVLVMVRSVRT